MSHSNGAQIIIFIKENFFFFFKKLNFSNSLQLLIQNFNQPFKKDGKMGKMTKETIRGNE